MSTLKIKRENGKIFCPLADSWHIETPEEKVRQEYIKILVEDYGYSLDQMAQEIRSITLNVVKAKHVQILLFGNQNRIKSKAKPLLLLLNVKRKMFVFVKKIIIRDTIMLLGLVQVSL